MAPFSFNLEFGKARLCIRGHRCAFSASRLCHVELVALRVDEVSARAEILFQGDHSAAKCRSYLQRFYAVRTTGLVV